ncbi:putative Cysteine/Histidine-rich C1 domain family protein [Melia azedarach]|uniref:Cysteine/Histidine-rich C1 domain family protein n=1 Tax=Melia azedarach TaxID=155640 RepID=A0ACC1XP69_MELAZ|nr:putative Cysteine/Histidine-rich C1 domain family protein [Melia azedarach]
MNLKYLLHKHRLTLGENIDGELLCPGCGDPTFGKSFSCICCGFYPDKCFACNNEPSGSFYFCQRCWPNCPLIHKSCAELSEEIEITFHQHSILYFKESRSSNKLDCDFCNQTSRYMYCCKECSFQIDIRCASMLIEYHEGQEQIEHLFHQHPLTLLEEHDAKCVLCDKDICGQTYACAPCEFFIHKSCGEWQQEVIGHPFHPHHCLTLQFTYLEGYRCEACRVDIDRGIHYLCGECNFSLHPECLSLTSNIRCEGHEHLLTLIENMYYQSICQACGFKIEGSFFVRCVECNLNFHVECGPLQLPETVAGKHHQHLLSLETKTTVDIQENHILHLHSDVSTVDIDENHILRCDVCEEEINSKHPYYCCVKCEFYSHVRCAVTEVQHKEREKLRHFSHRHFLFLQENDRNDDINCYACEKGCGADSIYGCNFCKLYLHKSCAELPREKEHPFHRHPLTLQETSAEFDGPCHACSKYCHAFTYACNDCNFVLDLDCASLQPSIEFEGHEHPLTFFEKLLDTPECKCCKFNPPDASYLRCVECDFNVHLFCSPLPRTIKHRSHECSLNLMDSLVVDYYDKQICDVCEEERDPQECVYYCAECNFIVEFNCVFSEVMLSLERNKGDVPLRIVSKELNDRVIRDAFTYDDIMKSYNVEENEIIKEFMWKIRATLGGISVPLNFQGDIRISQNFPYSDADVLLFMAMMKRKVKLTESVDVNYEVVKVVDVEDEVVKVEDYMVVPKLAPILKSLLYKYGDISGSCSLTQRLKTLAISVFCSTVQSMCSTRVMDITDKLILTWWFSFKFVAEAGFTIDFAFDHLKRILQARYGTDIDNSKSSPLYKLHGKMAQLSQEIDELTGEINKRKAEMDELNMESQNIIASNRSARSRLEAKHLSDALEFRRKNAVTGLL